MYIRYSCDEVKEPGVLNRAAKAAQRLITDSGRELRDDDSAPSEDPLAGGREAVRPRGRDSREPSVDSLLVLGLDRVYALRSVGLTH